MAGLLGWPWSNMGHRPSSGGGGTMKPLEQKAYGSIPHLPKSRLGPGDHFIHPGQQTILTEKPRDRHDRIIVTEKLDGSCVAVARKDGQLLALAKSGYLAQTSPYEHLQHFAVWVRQNEGRFVSLEEGERLCGEWISMAHGTIYANIPVPFVPFDLMAKGKRFPVDQMLHVAGKCDLTPAAIISAGPPMSVEDAIAAIKDGGFHGAQEDVEGCVWRCERKGEFDFIAKFVRHEKQDGKYFEQFTGQPPIWFWRPDRQAA
jgi:hypothetical protein